MVLDVSRNAETHRPNIRMAPIWKKVPEPKTRVPVDPKP